MFRPSASSTYSSAMSMMRTQALPNCCATSGTMNKATAATRNTTSFLSFMGFSCAGSGTVRHTLAEQAGRPHGQHEDQHDEGEDVLVMAAQDAAGERADVT